MTSDFSKDASAEVAQDNKFKKHDMFKGLLSPSVLSCVLQINPLTSCPLLLSALSALKASGDSKVDAEAAAHAYRLETVRAVYQRLAAAAAAGAAGSAGAGSMSMSEAQFVASKPVQTLLDRKQTSIEAFHKRLVAGTYLCSLSLSLTHSFSHVLCERRLSGSAQDL
jgi:hypothetical protein